MKRLLLLVFLATLHFATAQHQDKVDFVHADILIEPIPETKEIKGRATYSFELIENVDSVFLDAKNIEFATVKINGRKVEYANNGSIITLNKKFRKGKKYELDLVYSCAPKQTVYFLGWKDDVGGNEQIWTQGQGKYTSHWLPSFDDMEEKVEFDLNIKFNKDYTVIANGKSIAVEETESLKIWHFDMKRPMSSYLLAFAIGDYKKQLLSAASGIPIENYYYPQDSLEVEPTYRYTKQIFDFLEGEIGMPYPWQNYKQIPVHDFLYAGMENTGSTIFSDGYVIDSTAFVDKNYVNVNAHELVHQWFGNLVTEKDGAHHWLHEGFATYYAYLAEKQIFGDDHFYWKLYHTAKQLKEFSEKGKGEALTNPKASSLTFYEKGAWALVMLREKVGDKAFREGIKNYLQKYKFRNATVSDFLSELEKTSRLDLRDFRALWLDNKEFPWDDAKEILQQRCTSLKQYFFIDGSPEKGTSDFAAAIINLYSSDATSTNLKKQLILEHGEGVFNGLLKKLLASENIEVRQAVARSVTNVPIHLKPYFESMLTDSSYVTQETVLFKLWERFPEDRAKYLNKTKNVIGLPNKNVRLMWLTLAILTDGYEAPNTKLYFDELSSYTSSRYSFEVRQGAFFYLKEAFGFTDRNLLDLIEATHHHAWQFRKYTRNLIDDLLRDDDYLTRITKLSEGLKPEEIRYLNSKLEIE